jgi:hypothetical protein
MLAYSGASPTAVAHGKEFGTAVARAILAERKKDGAAEDTDTYATLGSPGTHRGRPLRRRSGVPRSPLGQGKAVRAVRILRQPRAASCRR